MYLAHVRLTRPGPEPEEADANLIQDVLWALVPLNAGIEHVRARAGPDGIDVTLFLRHDIPGQDPDGFARALLAGLARTSPPLGEWHQSTG